MHTPSLGRSVSWLFLGSLALSSVIACAAPANEEAASGSDLSALDSPSPSPSPPVSDSPSSSSGSSGSSSSSTAALEALLAARTADSAAGSALTEVEAQTVAWAICDVRDSAHCSAPDDALRAALDDVAIQSRVDRTAWSHLQTHVAAAVALAKTTSRPATVASWPSRRRNTTRRAVPFFVFAYADSPNDKSPWGTFRHEVLESYEGAAINPTAEAIFDNSTGDLVAFHARVGINSCGGCEDDLNVIIGVDGTILERTYYYDASYCC